MEFIEKKIAGGDSVDDVVQAGDDEDEGSGSKVLDLADYLARSFKKPPAAAKKAKPANKRTPAKKNAAKKTTAKKTRRSA